MKTPIKVLAKAGNIPAFQSGDVKTLMARLEMNEKSFALLMNVTPMTVKLWTSGAVQPCNSAQRLMQIYKELPHVIDDLLDEPVRH